VKPNSQQVRELLAEAPSTVDEIAVILGWPGRRAQVVVWGLIDSGQVRNTDRKNHEGRSIFEITPKGLSLL
jgi:hypothetical protein